MTVLILLYIDSKGMIPMLMERYLFFGIDDASLRVRGDEVVGEKVLEMELVNGGLVGFVGRSDLLLFGGKFGQVRGLVLDFEMRSED